MQAQELLVFQERVTEEATMAWDIAKADPSCSSSARARAARKMQQAVVLNLTFGHYPPPRITCLITTVVSDYRGPCRWGSCRAGYALLAESAPYLCANAIVVMTQGPRLPG